MRQRPDGHEPTTEEEPVAHRRFALDRKTVTVGLTAALLTVPMAGTASALSLEGALTETADALVEGTEAGADSLRATVESTLSAATDPVKTVVESVVEVAPAPVTETVETVVEAAPAPVAEVVAPRKEAEAASGGSSPEPVNVPASQPQQQRQSGTAPSGAAGGGTVSEASGAGAGAGGGAGQATAPALRNELRTTSGFRSSTERPSLQPAPAPLVSSPFAAQAPRVSGEAVQTPLTALSAAPQVMASAVDAMTATPVSGGDPATVPGALTATAAGLLLLVGAGHALHRTGALRRSVVR
jgi:hypothetical protein